MSKNACWSYLYFGEKCPSECEYSHEGYHYDSSCFIADLVIFKTLTGRNRGKLLELKCFDNKKTERTDENVQLPTKKFFVREHFWKKFGKNVEERSTLLFQASKHHQDINDWGNVQSGRILTVLGKVEQIPIRFSLKYAFTVDSKGTKIRNSAISIEECNSKEPNCLKIGLHITLAAIERLAKLKHEYIPHHCGKFQGLENSSAKFDKDCTVLALSVYYHTSYHCQSEKIEITAVKITDNYTWSNAPRDGNCGKLLKLFTTGKGNAWIGYKDLFPKHFERTGDWEWSYTWEMLMEKYVSVVRSFFPETSFIGRCWEKNPQLHTRDVVLPATVYRELEGRKTSFDKRVLEFASTAMRYRIGVSQYLIGGRFRFRCDVDEGTEDDGNQSDKDYSEIRIQCTSPIKNFLQQVNQQIIVNHMTGRKKNLYSKNELLGLMTVRYRTPVLQKAMITDVRKNFMRVRFPDLRYKNVSKQLTQVNLSIFGPEVKCSQGDIQIPSVTLNVSCPEDEYLNEEVIRFDNISFNRLQKSLSDLDAPFECKDIEEFQSRKSPYRKDGDNTIITLEPGVQLYLQISNADAEEGNPIRIRILKIGKSCPYCFIHRTNFEWAFLSPRRDVRDRLDRQRIRSLQQQQQKKQSTPKRIGQIKVIWRDEYYSGGTFEIDEELTVGDLLCIFQEAESDGPYIWNCHGVVSSCLEKNVNFLVCTLSQTEKCKTQAKFIIDIIHQSETVE